LAEKRPLEFFSSFNSPVGVWRFYSNAMLNQSSNEVAVIVQKRVSFCESTVTLSCLYICFEFTRSSSSLPIWHPGLSVAPCHSAVSSDCFRGSEAGRLAYRHSHSGSLDYIHQLCLSETHPCDCFYSANLWLPSQLEQGNMMIKEE